MIIKYSVPGKLGIGIGLLLMFVEKPLLEHNDKIHYTPETIAMVALISVLIGTGCVQYVRAKGYSGWLGILGLLPGFAILGIILALALPDKLKGADGPPPLTGQSK